MAVNDVLGQLQVLLKKSTPLIETGEKLPEEPLRFSPGQQVQARVLSTLPNGRFLVLVDDRHLDLNLPRNTQPGSNIDLRFVGNQPRPTFILANDAAQLPARGTVSLSDTARFIGALLDKANQLSTRAETPLARSAPVLQGEPPADVRQFAVALRSALSQSGLFYESHQAQWVAGERSLGELLKEPQAQLSEPRAFAASQQTAAQTSTQGDAAHAAQVRPQEPARPEQLPPNTPQTLVAADKQTDTAARAGIAIAGREQTQPEQVHSATTQVVQQQLDALDTRQVMWQGEVWPGQIMHWQIEERDARDGTGAESANEWQTHLNLTLPNLGEVGAQLRLGPQGIRIDITTAEADTAKRLQETAGQLRTGFERADLNLLQVTVKQHG